MVALLALLVAAAGCGKTLVDENGKNLIPSVCSCTAPAGGSPVCNPDGSCDYLCTGALLKCGGECIPCSAPASASPACVQGACGFTCNTPARLCPAAPGGAPTCQVESDGSCGPSCAACPGPAVGPGRGVCQAGPAIGAGACALACDAGNHACGLSCFADDDAANCGASCQVCSAPVNASPLCTGGSCAFACNPGWMRCAGGCCRAEAVAAGGEFTCAILDDGRVRCWGANDRGQLGDGSTLFRPVPVDVVGLPAAPSRAVALAAGWAHACAAVSQGGQVWCWGDNTTGELGPAAAAAFSPLPVAVTGASGVSAPLSPSSPATLAAGGGVSGSPFANFGHSCASAAGGLLCWGANGSGQLGDGSTTQSAAPRAVSGISATAGVAAGERHTCATTAAGLRCWGANGSGQLGDGTTTASSTPRPVSASAFPAGTPSFAAAGRASSCAAVGTASQLFCWGDNAEGQVTTSPPPPAIQLTPVAPSLGGGFAPTFVAAGRAHVCGLEPGSNTLKCFGANGQSQLSGAPTPTGKNDVLLTGAGGLASTVTAGGDHTCALLVDGSIQCWGANERGQTGTGLPAASVVTPSFVSGR
jgi:alpha-tubulin suppressor-like RCC1 family protein